tara:strand:- start:30 stop:851 length:822 start_codon:yes stop_codon:yes gene_type:complete
MVNKYFNVVVKPTILASKLAIVYGSGDVVFDWHAVDVPKGASKLVGVTAIMRQKHGTAGNEHPFQLVYGKSINNVDPSSLGTNNATADGTGYYNNVIGKSTFVAKDYMSDILDNGVTIAALTQGGADSEKPSIILEGEPNGGTNVGYDKIYVGMIAEGAFDFTTAAEISQAIDVSGLSAAQLVNADIEGTDPRLVFAPGDVIHAADDVNIGEIESMADANTITFKADGSATASETDFTVPANLAAWIAATGDLADGDELINVNPIKIILHFEK